jgi:hypothetical protein
MIRVEDAIDVEQTRDAVFAFVADLGNIPQYQAEVVRSTVITPGPVRVGTKFEEVVRLGPWRINARCEVTEFDGLGVMGFKADSSPVGYEGRITVTPSGSGCRVAIAGSANLRGAWRLLTPVLAGDIRRGVRHELEAIKKLTEVGARPTPTL